MRTTVTIDDRLLELARQRARSQGRTLGDLVEESLHHFLAMPKPAPGPDLPVFTGGGGFMPGIDPCSNVSMLDVADGDLGADRR